MSTRSQDCCHPINTGTTMAAAPKTRFIVEVDALPEPLAIPMPASATVQDLSGNSPPRKSTLAEAIATIAQGPSYGRRGGGDAADTAMCPDTATCPDHSPLQMRRRSGWLRS